MAENKQGGKFEISPKAAIQIAQQYQVLGLMTGRRLYEEVIREDLKDFGACSKRKNRKKKGPHGPFLIQTKSVEHNQTSVGIVPWPLPLQKALSHQS
jgi:hypothetical protein